MTEVTNQQYQQFLAATGHRQPHYWNDSRFNKPDLPVVGVTWEDATQYAAWVGKRLPTEAEWEYAARGGLYGAKFPWGNEQAKDRAWHGKPFNFGAPTKVASFSPNAYGLYDMAGNAAEWCADWFRDDAYRDANANNPTGPANSGQKVVRGGSWYEDLFFLRCAARKGMSTTTHMRLGGFSLRHVGALILTFLGRRQLLLYRLLFFVMMLGHRRRRYDRLLAGKNFRHQAGRTSFQSRFGGSRRCYYPYPSQR